MAGEFAGGRNGSPAGRAKPRRLPENRRATCVWLGGLASCRPGLIKRLVKVHGSISEVVDLDPGDLVEALRVSARGRQMALGSAGGSPESKASGARPTGDERATSRFEAVLDLSPSQYLDAVDSSGEGRMLVAWCDPLYPPALRQLADPPLCLFVRHDCSGEELTHRLQALCVHPVVAVVGTRAPSIYGEEMAARLARDLTRRGVLVVSGLAMGIDATAQAAAVDAAPKLRTPTTVGVLGCGADVVYPRVNRKLFDAVGRTGLLVSEFAWGVPARAWHFPARNRVMAGLARAVVVVEGADRSGARLTADFALDLGRDVLAVPGEAGRRLTAAPHALLRQGAALCESADDVLAAITPLGVEPPAAKSPNEGRLSHPQQEFDNGSGVITSVLTALRTGPLSADQVSRRCAIPVHTVGAALSELEVEGLAYPVDGGAYRLRQS